MIHKIIGLNQSDLYKKVGNILNKVAESMENRNDIELKAAYQPEDNPQDKRLMDDAFKSGVRKAIRCMAPYVNNDKNNRFDMDPSYIALAQTSGSDSVIQITSDSEWTLSVSDSEHQPYTFFIALRFPETWLDNDIMQSYVEDLVATQMIASYLENVDKRQAEWYRREVDEKAHDVKTACASRKPGTRFYVTSPFGENPYRRY